MKKISVLIPCYNEEENVVQIAAAVSNEMETNLPNYDYEIVFIDNDSKDSTRPLIREVCRRNPKVKAIFNVKNFGQFNSPYYGLQQTTGNCTILMCCDFQDPVEMIPLLVKEWEKGAKIVSCIKTKSKENPIMRFFRTFYYKIIKKMSSIEQIEHFTGFGLYDKSFIDVLKNLDDPTPFLRGIVAELGYKRVSIEYTQAKRRAGKTKNNFMSLFEAAMLSFTSYTKVGMHLVTIIGFILAILSTLVGLVYLVLKLIYWDRFSAGIMPMMIGLFFLNAVELVFIGLVGEYVMSVNTRIMKRPLVIEEERINFESEKSPTE
ncbi:MAG: glycosyltransferase family 2 protein [Bacteroidales bacterium]|nr:glycosyltransferase family 2 protein [Bacteroidales bacterium]